VFNFLNGKKSYIGIIVFGVYNILVSIFPNLGETVKPELVNTLLLTWTGISFRDALKRMED